MIVVPLVAVLVVGRLTGVAPSPASSSSPALSVPPSAAPLPDEDRTPEIRGRILDADGNAATGASVRLVSPRPPYKVLREATADAAGAFSFDRVAEERVRVVADRDPGGVVTSAEQLPEPGRSVDVVLVLVPAGAVRGTVVDGDDHPVAGAVVTVEGAPWITRRQTSDEAGAFRLATVPAEATSLVVVARGYRRATVALPTGGDANEVVVRVKLEAAPPVQGEVVDEDGTPVAARVVACEGQPTEEHVESNDQGAFEVPASAIGCQALAERDDAAPSDPAPVVEGRSLRLRLRAGGSLEGAVVDARGAGVPSYRLGIESFVAARGSARAMGSRGSRPVDDPRGAFQWEKLPPGSYVLTASAPGLPPARSDSVEVVGGKATRNVRIVLVAGGVVTGHVFDDKHAPLPGVELAFDLVSSVVASRASATTDESGAYRLEGAPAGPFTLRARKDGFRLRMVSALRVASGQTLTQDLLLTPSDGQGGIELGGIGATIAQSREGIVIGSVFGGDPADRAGLSTGDRILRIDGESTDGMSSADAIQRIRGQVGTSVGLSVRRAATGDTVDVVVVRGSIVR
jgi:hypothetical protein